MPAFAYRLGELMGANQIDATRFASQTAGPAHSASALYTPEQRERRDNSRWTLVQGLLAPIQFLACLVSIALIARFLVDGQGLQAAHISVWVKTALLLLIMITGAIWERVVFGQYLFAKAFFWEDVMSMIVIGFHLFYAWAAMQSNWPASKVLYVALAAYGLYLFNAAQFIYKLRQARLSDPKKSGSKISASGQV